MDVNIAVPTPLSKPTQSYESQRVEKKHMTMTLISLSKVRTYMPYGSHFLEHAQDKGISLLVLDSCYMAGELIHNMVCWKEHFHIWY